MATAMIPHLSVDSMSPCIYVNVLHEGQKWDGTYATTFTTTKQKNDLKQAALAFLSGRNTVFGPRYEGKTGWATGFCVHLTGEAQPKNKEDSHEEHPAPSNNRPFLKRKKQGEMILSPRKIGKVTTKSVAGRLPSRIEHGRYSGVLNPITVGYGRIRGNRCFISDRHFFFTTVDGGDSAMFRFSYSLETFSWAFGSFPTARHIYRSITDNLTIDTGLVTQVQARANERDIDLLTEMAEAPQSLAMILDAFGALGKMIRDLKRGEISLKKIDAIRRKNNRKTIDEQLMEASTARERALSKSSKPKHISNVWDSYNRKVARIEKQRNNLEKIAKRAYVTELASLWLQFRYGVMPLVYTANSALDVIAQSSSEYLTERGRLQTQFIVADAASNNLRDDATCTLVQRCMVKHQVKPGLHNGFSFNPLKTMWELTTLSFVVDWFLNIGDLISAYSPSFAINTAAFYSNRVEDSGTASFKNIQGAHVIYHIDVYNATPIDPHLCGGLVFNPSMNLYRYLDAMSLAWNRSKLRIKAG